MEEARVYPGLAGEIVRQFIRFETFIICIPMAAAWLALSLISYCLDGRISGHLLNYTILIISFCLLALFIGRFAMASAHGDYHCGFSSHQLAEREMMNFAVRLILFNLTWLIPSLIVTYYVLQGKNPLELFILLKFGISLGYAGLWYALLVIMVFFGPLIAALLATYTRTIGDVFSFSPWYWLSERGADLPAYLAQVVGGMVLFFMKYFLPMFILKVIIFKLSIKAGIYLNTAFSALPLLLVPIILGRLCGAFVAMNEIDDGFRQSKAESKASQRSNNFLSDQKKSYEQIIKDIETMSLDDIEAAERMLNGVDENIYRSLSLSYFYKKNKKPHQALEQCKTTIDACLAKGMGYEAVKLFRYYFKEKTALNLGADQLMKLAHYLALQNAYVDAAWCYLMAILQLPKEEQLATQKKFLHVASTAKKQGENKVANSLFLLFCKQFPDSSLTEFAKRQISE